MTVEVLMGAENITVRQLSETLEYQYDLHHEVTTISLNIHLL
jgi:hypothetical protein